MMPHTVGISLIIHLIVIAVGKIISLVRTSRRVSTHARNKRRNPMERSFFAATGSVVSVAFVTAIFTVVTMSFYAAMETVHHDSWIAEVDIDVTRVIEKRIVYPTETVNAHDITF